MIPNELDFSLEEICQKIPVVVPNEDGTSLDEFELISMSGQDATTYQNAKASSIKFDSNGQPVGFNKIADLAPLLISLCLRRKGGGLVSKSTVGKFPYKVQQKLFEVAQEMNGLNEEVRYTEAMLKVFDAPDSPVDMEEVRDWLSSQDDSDKSVQLVTLLFKETDSEIGKK
jgi:hypothetical protein